MRIIAGTRKSRRLKSLSHQDTRPTLDMVKEGVFSSIQSWIEGSSFLDLFAGSGNIGLESLSRGAKHAVFVDGAQDAIKIIHENIKDLGFEKQASVYRMDALQACRYLKNKQQTFDIVYLDPPYGKVKDEVLFRQLLPLLHEKSLVLYETSDKHEVKLDEEHYAFDKSLAYGRIKVYQIRRKL